MAKRWMRRGMTVLALVLIPALTFCRPAADKGEIKMDDSGYSTRFADHRRSSYQNVRVGCSGEILWSKGLSAGVGAPEALYLFDGRGVVVSSGGFSVYLGSGVFQWSHEKLAGSPIAIADSLIYYQDEHYRLSAVDVLGESKVSSSYFPGPINDDYPVSLLSVGRKDHLSVIQFTGGAEELPRKVMIKRTTHGNRLSEWTCEVEGSQVMPPLYLKELEQAVIFAGMIYFVDTASGDEKTRVEIPFVEPGLASAGPDGTIYITGTGDKGHEVIAMSSGTGNIPVGEIMWRWGLPEGKRLSRFQPPIVGPDGTVWLISGPEVFAVRDGELAWTTSLEEGGFSFGTAFEGGMIVLVSGKRLIGTDIDGKQVFDVEFEEPIVAPPVGMGDGTMLLLTADRLLRVR
ncbi:MAG: PQQ-binding-like beta-propeller repeat protein [Candidatus Krumholzibacteria bacterium]|nr:PQQ-binding-like beta-propeller repeat protein [Candidatus Krumholzibacteria bacterium]